MKKEIKKNEQDMPTLNIEEEIFTNNDDTIPEEPLSADTELSESAARFDLEADDIPGVHSDNEETSECSDEEYELVEEDEEEEERPERNWRKSLLTFAHDVLYLLAILIVMSLLLRVVVVDGTSMTNTLKDGDYILVLSNVFYQNPKQGDIIVASKDTFEDGAPIVKRVIATEGQTVDIDFNRGIVYVDGIALDEPYTKTPTTLFEGVTFPLVVEEGCIFVLGDNRNGSRDSRHPDIGQIHKKEVIGKVIFLFLPGTNGENIYGEPNEPRDFSRIGVLD